MIPPIPDRYDMAYFAQKHFFQLGTAVEVGVFKGEFSAHNLKEWNGQYLMVDTWAYRSDGTTDKNNADPEYWRGIEREAMQKTGFAKDRRSVEKGYSVEVAEKTKDGSFDWVYLDAGHDYENVKDDLNAWWPKLRSGGLFSGDDYGLCEDDQRLYPMTADRFERGINGIARAFKWGTALALHEFCEARNLQLHVTWLNDFANPAWYIIKPSNE